MSDLRTLLVEHIPHLRRYAIVLLRNVDLADDLVQDCLIRAIERSDQWRPGTNLRAWLFTILHNLFIDGKRRAAARPTLVSMDGQLASPTVPPNQIDSIDLRNLEKALHALPEDQRTTVILVGLEGFSYEETASITGVPVGTVRSRLSRGRDALRLALAPDQERSSTGGGDAASAIPD